MEIPSALMKAVSSRSAGIVMVIGGPDTGKTTLVEVSDAGRGLLLVRSPLKAVQVYSCVVIGKATAGL